jgi:hypothetical protein
MFLLFLLISFLLSPLPVRADYASAYVSYGSAWENYRAAHGSYQVARSSYRTYGTLESQNAAITSFRSALKARSNLQSAYLDLITAKMQETPGVTPTEVETQTKIAAGQKEWFTGHQSKIDAAASLEDLNAVSKEFSDRYPQMSLETRQAVGTILLAKEIVLGQQVSAYTDSLGNQIGVLRSTGEDTVNWDRGLLSARNKIALVESKLAVARTAFFPERRYEAVDVFDGQRRLTEANQYLRETINYCREILNAITG